MNREEKKTIIIFIGVGVCIGLMIAIFINIIKVKTITYEYLKDGKFGKSNQCYVDKKQDCMCLIDGNFQYVEQYYYIE